MTECALFGSSLWYVIDFGLINCISCALLDESPASLLPRTSRESRGPEVTLFSLAPSSTTSVCDTFSAVYIKKKICPKWLTVIHTYIHRLMVTSTSGAVLGFNILPKDILTSRPGESNHQPSNNKTLALPLSHSRPPSQNTLRHVDKTLSSLWSLCDALDFVCSFITCLCGTFVYKSLSEVGSHGRHHEHCELPVCLGPLCCSPGAWHLGGGYGALCSK